MIKKTPTREFCKNGRELEKLALRAPLDAEDKKRLEHHLCKCPQCQTAFLFVNQLFGLIEEELKRPVHNKVLDLAKSLSSSQVEYGLLVCRPISPCELSPHSTLFCAELLFYANGSRYGEKEKLADVRKDDLKDYLTIRAMSDLHDNKLLLYLWQADCENFAGWKLRMDDKEIAVSTDGQAAIPLCGIRELNGKLIEIERDEQSQSP